MEYKIDDKKFYVFELMYDNDYGTYWHIEENKDTFKEVKDFKELKDNVFNLIRNGNDTFESIDSLNENKKIMYVRKSANEFIYGSNSKNLTKNSLNLK